MTIFKNELYKIFTDKLIVFLLAALLCAYAVFSIFNSADEFISDSMYRQISNELSGKTMSEKHEYLEEKTFEYNIYDMLAWAMDDYKGLLNDPRAFEYITSFQEQGYGLQHSWELYLYKQLYERELAACEAMYDYPEFLISIKSQSESMLRMSIFVKPGTFEYKNIERTPSAYDSLTGTQPEYYPSQGINQLLNSYVADIMLVLLVIIAAMKLFCEEKRTGISRLTMSMKNGRYTLFVGKIAAVFTFTAVMVIVFVLAGAVIAELKYGLGDLNRQLQSVQGFMTANINVTVMQYLLMFSFTKILAIFLIALATVLLCVTLGNATLIYGVLAGIAGVFFLLYTQITLTSYLALLGRINPIAFIEVNGIFMNYYNFNIFGEPVNIIPLSLIAIAVLIIVLFISSMLLFPKYSGYRELSLIPTGKKLRISSNLLGHEAYKILVGNKAAIILIVLAVMAYNSYTSFSEFYSAEEMYYRNYTTRTAGYTVPDAELFIADEQAYFDKINEDKMELMNAYLNGELSEIQYSTANALLTQAEAGIGAFYRFRERVEYLKSNDIPSRMYYDTGYNKLVAASNYAKDMELSLLLVIFLVLAVAPVFAADNEKGANKIISTTKKGRGGTLLTRLIIVFSLSTLIFALCHMPFLINILNEYGTTGMTEPIQSVRAFADFPFEMSLKSYLITLYLVRLLSALTVCTVITAVSVYSRNIAASVLISSVFLLIPLIIGTLFAENMAVIGFTPLLGGNAVLQGGIVNLIIIILGSAGLCVLAGRRIIRNR